MRLYMTVDGTIVGTQREAGKGFTTLIIPMLKEGLIDWLNTNRERFVQVVSAPLPVPPPASIITVEMLEGHTEGLSADRQGPKEHRLAERAAFLGTSEEVSLMADRIAELDGWPLGQCALAVAARFKELAS